VNRVYQHQYHLHTERMIAFILERLDEDEVLARGMKHEPLHRLYVNAGSVRAGIRAYRQAMHRAFNHPSDLWWQIATLHAFALRRWVGVYRDREAYAPRWRYRHRHPGR
jgi:hypothetical protein